MIIVISAPDDSHLPLVQRHLADELYLINNRDILTDTACSYVLKAGKVHTTKQGRQLKQVKSVWNRRAMSIQSDELPVPRGMQDYAHYAIKYFNGLIFNQFADAFWLSDNFAIERASDKLWQLQVAHSLGLHVPETVFASTATVAREFVDTHKKVVAKPTYVGHFSRGGKRYGFYTSYVDMTTDFSGLHLAPAIFQEAIQVKTELRITVIGKEVFAATVASKSTSPEHIRDWRAGDIDDNAILNPFELPATIRKACIDLVGALGLQFGAIDIIIDKHGKYWFLENNPNGQWAFVERATGQPIGKAIATLLQTQGRSAR